MPQELLQHLEESVNYIKSRTSLRPRVGITLGSGLSAFADQIEVNYRIPYAEIPHFAPPTIEGHPGQLVIGTLQGVPLAILQGRIHYYEGHSMQDVAYPTRVLARLGIETLILTNAAGGIDKNMKPGQFMIITDQLNLTGDSPLRGANISEIGPRFPDMSEIYDSTLVKKLRNVMKSKKAQYSEGIYCGVIGPSYETPAEVRYLQMIGGNAVGMSTVAEAIAARHMGLRVCGVSCVTNLAAGLSPTPLTHEEVKEVAQRVEKEFAAILTQFVGELKA